MPEISVRGLEMPESPIRKLAPLAAAAKKRGIKVYHLNIGQPDLPTPKVGLEALKSIDREILEYSPSQGYLSYREKLVGYYKKYNIKRKAAIKNGQRIETSARGNAGAYIYDIDAEAFCKAMDEMVSSYGDGLKEMLGGTMNCVQVTKVCSFIGNVIRMHVINDVNLQTVDLLFAFEGYYDNMQTVQAKLGDRKTCSEQKVILGTFEGLLRKYKA